MVYILTICRLPRSFLPEQVRRSEEQQWKKSTKWDAETRRGRKWRRARITITQHQFLVLVAKKICEAFIHMSINILHLKYPFSFNGANSARSNVVQFQTASGNVFWDIQYLTFCLNDNDIVCFCAFSSTSFYLVCLHADSLQNALQVIAWRAKNFNFKIKG